MWSEARQKRLNFLPSHGIRRSEKPAASIFIPFHPETDQLESDFHPSSNFFSPSPELSFSKMNDSTLTFIPRGNELTSIPTRRIRRRRRMSEE